jgi:ribosomal-protein-serine acetyltransferase
MQKDIKLVKGKILLRPYRPGDAVCMFEAAIESINELDPWMPWCHAGYTMEESENWIKSCDEAWDKGTAHEFAVLDSQTGQYLGGCGLNHIDPVYKTANLGYWVRSGSTRHGIATTATMLLARFGFAQLKLNRIEIIIAVENSKSQRVAEKSGAKREGILRNRISINDQVHDAVVFSFIPQDFCARPPVLPRV